jgi:hypothetical protein
MHLQKPPPNPKQIRRELGWELVQTQKAGKARYEQS